MFSAGPQAVRGRVETIRMIACETRQMLGAHRYGASGTLSKKLDGHPFGSITPYLVDHDGSLLILISNLAEHIKNILHDPHVSRIPMTSATRISCPRGG